MSTATLEIKPTAKTAARAAKKAAAKEKNMGIEKPTGVGRTQALDRALGQIEQSFGKGSIMRLDKDASLAFPTNKRARGLSHVLCHNVVSCAVPVNTRGRYLSHVFCRKDVSFTFPANNRHRGLSHVCCRKVASVAFPAKTRARGLSHV